MPTHIYVPAAPGTYATVIHCDLADDPITEDSTWVEEASVLAWKISDRGIPEPILFDGPIAGAHSVVWMHEPDGRLRSREYGIAADLDEAKRYSWCPARFCQRARTH